MKILNSVNGPSAKIEAHLPLRSLNTLSENTQTRKISDVDVCGKPVTGIAQSLVIGGDKVRNILIRVVNKKAFYLFGYEMF